MQKKDFAWLHDVTWATQGTNWNKKPKFFKKSKNMNRTSIIETRKITGKQKNRWIRNFNTKLKNFRDRWSILLILQLVCQKEPKLT